MAWTVSFNVHPLPTEGINYWEERIGGQGEFSMAKNLRDQVSNCSFYRGGSIPSMEEEIWIFHENTSCIYLSTVLHVWSWLPHTFL